jgi:hypothetical protein
MSTISDLEQKVDRLKIFIEQKCSDQQKIEIAKISDALRKAANSLGIIAELAISLVAAELTIEREKSANKG